MTWHIHPSTYPRFKCKKLKKRMRKVLNSPRMCINCIAEWRGHIQHEMCGQLLEKENGYRCDIYYEA